MSRCFDGDIKSTELVARIVTNIDLKVVEVRTQVHMQKLPKRIVRLDILVTDS